MSGQFLVILGQLRTSRSISCVKMGGKILGYNEVEVVNLGTETDNKEVKIGANLKSSVKKRLIQLLHDYVEVFAWYYEDMPGHDADIVVHCLPRKEDCPPVKQKVCRMRPDMSEKIKAEVMKQFNA